MSSAGSHKSSISSNRDRLFICGTDSIQITANMHHPQAAMTTLKGSSPGSEVQETAYANPSLSSRAPHLPRHTPLQQPHRRAYGHDLESKDLVLVQRNSSGRAGNFRILVNRSHRRCCSHPYGYPQWLIRPSSYWTSTRDQTTGWRIKGKGARDS